MGFIIGLWLGLGLGLQIATARSRHVGRLLMFVAHVGENGVDTPVYIVHWRSTTDGKIATWIVALTPPLIPLRLITIS